MNNKLITLYTTSGCHLCEQAAAMFNYLIESDPKAYAQLALISVDIASDDSLVEQYGIRIPVLSDGKDELGWPFEIHQLKDWLLRA